MEQNSYNVLWVEDNDKIVEGYQSRARRAGLNLIRVSNWDDAELRLNDDFEDYSAIILDAACKIHATDEVDKETFIPSILLKLSELFATKQKYIPWYILSAGTMKQFNFVVDAAQESRIEFKDEWGEMVFKKDAPDEEPLSPEALFRQICKVSEDKIQNSVLCWHEKVFSYLGKGRVIDSPEARRTLLGMLDAFYSPEDDRKFQYKGNDLRIILECVFNSAKKYGLLPEECFDKNGVVLAKACDFMAGRNIECYENNKMVYKLRWGKAGEGENGAGKGCDSIFNPFAAKCVKSVLDYATKASHEFVNENTKELYFGYVMHLCHVIRDFGEFVEENKDAKKNMGMHRNPGVSYNKDEILNMDYTVLSDGGFYYAGECKLSLACQANVKLGKKVKIKELSENVGKDKQKYPFIATKITLLP